MSRVTASESDLILLRALALPTQRQDPDYAGWWSASDLRGDPRTFRTFGHLTVRQISGRAVSLTRKGMARTRVIGGSHGWAEYRITSYGLGLISEEIQDPDKTTATEGNTKS